MATGIDFSFSRVPASSAWAAGHVFGVSYLTDLDTDHRVKAWTADEIRAYRAAGLGVVAVWQGGGSDRTTAWRGGYDRGRRDALRAATQATALGRPDGRPVYFAIDADTSAADLVLVGRYFDGVASVFDRANIGVYGGRAVIEWAQRTGAASWFWQTGAWSGSVVLPGIHLYQRVPSTRLGGYAIDIDDAMQADYGGWFQGGSTMPDLWMPGATRLDSGDRSGMDGGPAKAIGHITWDRNATRAAPQELVPWGNLVDWFGRNPEGIKAAPHVLWNPWTGQFVQFVPANCRSKSLADGPGGTRTNRAGVVVIQVEGYFFPWCIGPDGRVYERLVDTPCRGWGQLNAWIRSWGVPDVWPMGRPASFVPNRSESVWESRAGWYAHGQVPENDHQDPGSWPAFTSQLLEDDVELTDTVAMLNPAEPGVAEADLANYAASVRDSLNAGVLGQLALKYRVLPALDPNAPLPDSHKLTQADADLAQNPALLDYAPTRSDVGLSAVRADIKAGAALKAIGEVKALLTAPTPVTVDAAAVAAALATNASFLAAIAKAVVDEDHKRSEA